MSFVGDRNPSPPPEFSQQEQDLAPDRVGESVFSKQWLIQVLINIVEAVGAETSEKTNEGQSEPSNKEQESTSNEIREIDPKLEDNVCALWDMSVNKDVADFLQEFKVVDILIEAIVKTKCPRLVEMSVGILANLASFDDVCQDLSRHDSLFETIIPLSGSSDAPTVVQVLRLIRTIVVNEAVSELWLDILRADSSFMDNMRFILENSLNGEILKGALQVLYYVLDADNLCVTWAEENYTKAIAAVAMQLASRKDTAALDELWLLLNLMCQNEENVIAIGKHFDVLHRVFFLYISLFGEYDHTVLPCPERTAAVAAAYTTFATISKNNEDYCKILKDDTFLKTVERMYKATVGVLTKCIILGETLDENDEGESPKSESSFQETSREQTPGSNADCNPSRSKNEFRCLLKISKDEHDALFILKETMVEFCKLIQPSIVQGDDG